MSENNINKETSKDPADKKNKQKKKGFAGWLKRNIILVFLLLVIIAGGGYLLVKMNMIERRAANERQELMSYYENKLDSLRNIEMERSVQVLSWAVRSEMMRDNLEQVNQYFINFLREPGVKRIFLADATDGYIFLSTDKNDEGTTVSDNRIIEAEDVTSFEENNSTLVVAPVMGLNSRLGILVVETGQVD